VPRTRTACLVFLASAALVSAQPSESEVADKIKARGHIKLSGYDGNSDPPTVASVESANVTDDDLRQVGRLTSLTGLGLAGKNITDAGVIASLTGSKLRITYVVIDGGMLTDATLKAVGGLPKLERLFIRTEGFTNVALAGLKSCPELRSIELCGKEYGDEAVRSLAGVKKLQSLQLESTAVTGAGFAALAGSKELKQVRILSAKITDARLQGIGTLKQLEELALSQDVSLTDAGLAHVAGMTKLTKLWLSGATISDAGMKQVAKLPAVAEITLKLATVSDAGVAELANSKSLRKLSLSDTDVTDAGLLPLSRCKSLVEVYAPRTRVSLEGIAAFQKALPTCKVVTKRP